MMNGLFVHGWLFSLLNASALRLAISGFLSIKYWNQSELNWWGSWAKNFLNRPWIALKSDPKPSSADSMKKSTQIVSSRCEKWGLRLGLTSLSISPFPLPDNARRLTWNVWAILEIFGLASFCAALIASFILSASSPSEYFVW